MNIEEELTKLANQLIYVFVDLEVIGSDEWEFKYIIKYILLRNHNEKRRAQYMQTIDSFSYSGGACYSGAWHTREEAYIEGIKKGNELLKKQQDEV